MTSIIRSTAAVGLALALTAAAAAAQQATPRQPGADRAQDHEMRGPRRGGRGDRGPGPLFRGITLTADQQQRLRTINDRYNTQGRALREQMRPAAEQARAARQRGDTAAARTAWQGSAEQRRQFAQLQQRRLQEARGVLTAEQQRQFDTNRAEFEKRMAERRAERGNGNGQRGFRGGRGPRG